MKKEILIILITVCGLAILWSFWSMWRLSTPVAKIELGLTEQRKIYTAEPTVYLDDKPLPPCSEDIETRICVFSCAPEGICVFVPREIMEKYNFNN